MRNTRYILLLFAVVGTSCSSKPTVPERWRGVVPTKGLHHVGECQPAATTFCADYDASEPVATFLAGFHEILRRRGGFEAVCLRPATGSRAPTYVLQKDGNKFVLHAAFDGEKHHVTLRAWLPTRDDGLECIPTPDHGKAP